MKKLVIDRKRWLRGDGLDNILSYPEMTTSSFLYRDKDKKMCCLGFFCRQLSGLTIDDIRNMPDPLSVLTIKGVEKKGMEVLLAPLLNKQQNANNTICGNLMLINDAEDMTEKERENGIIKLFKKINVKVKFIN